MVKVDLYKKDLIGDTCSPTFSMRKITCFFADAVKHNARVNQFDFIGAFLQAKVKNRVFVKLDIIYEDHFPEYSDHFGRYLILLKYLYGMTNSGKLFKGNLT